MGLGKTVQVCSYLGAMAASRKLRSILIIVPATMLTHWLSELATWAPGLRRIMIHSSAGGEGGGGGGGTKKGKTRTVTRQLLNHLERWLTSCRADRVYEPIDERDLEESDPSSFCGTGYVVLTTYENIRRAADVWVNHQWSYVIMDEGQKIRNPDADVTLACKVSIYYVSVHIISRYYRQYHLYPPRVVTHSLSINTYTYLGCTKIQPVETSYTTPPSLKRYTNSK